MHKNLIAEYNIYLAEDGIKAMDMLPHIPKPDIIISDIIMSGMDGHELYKNITMHPGYSDIPVLFLTGKQNREEKLKSLQDGVIDYIYKPFSMDEVRAKIESIVRNREKATEMNRKKIADKIKTVIYTENETDIATFEDKCVRYKLSSRERDVAKLTLEGKQIKEIAVKFDLSIHTVRNHLQRIYKKCRVSNRVELLNVFRG